VTSRTSHWRYKSCSHPKMVRKERVLELNILWDLIEMGWKMFKLGKPVMFRLFTTGSKVIIIIIFINCLLLFSFFYLACEHRAVVTRH